MVCYYHKFPSQYVISEILSPHTTANLSNAFVEYFYQRRSDILRQMKSVSTPSVRIVWVPRLNRYDSRRTQIVYLCECRNAAIPQYWKLVSLKFQMRIDIPASKCNHSFYLIAAVMAQKIRPTLANTCGDCVLTP